MPQSQVHNSAGKMDPVQEDALFYHSNGHNDSPYILSPVCGGCFRSKNEGGTQCYDVIERTKNKIERVKPNSNSTLIKAAQEVARTHKGCEICDPDKCGEHHGVHDIAQYNHHYYTKYWRFDDSAPRIKSATTLTLKSIPSQFRIPPSRFDNIRQYFIEKFASLKQNNLSGMDFFVEYNPGLVSIPQETKKYLPKEATYLLSLRVTPANNCFPTDAYSDLPKPVWEAVYHTSINHLGLALLDENYQMLPGYDVVIEVDTQVGLKRNSDFRRSTFVDYRLFVLNGEIYLHVNADTVIMTRLILKAQGYGDDDKIRDKHIIGDQPFKLNNLFGGDQLEVTLAHQFNTLWTDQGVHGKNFAIFTVPNATHPNDPSSIYAEIDITPLHQVQQIQPERFESISLQRVFEHVWKKGTRKRRNLNIDNANRRSMITVGNATKSDIAPLASFSTLDEHRFPGNSAPFKESAHGGSCCVSFSVNDINMGGTRNNHHESLLVGIAHTKVSWKPWYGKDHIPQKEKDLVPHTHYVSFFYAFDPRPPFQIRARSGYFCLGHAPETFDDTLPSEEGGEFNPHSVLTRNRPLLQYNVTFDCPQMHYISTFIEKAGDPTSTVIGYGLNDCTPRLVEVEKKEITRLLFPDPMDMVLEILQ